jgi:hypothetical protein
MVVMGMNEIHPEYGYENTTTFIMRHAKYPVLAVPEDVSFTGISKTRLRGDGQQAAAAHGNCCIL